MDYKLEQILDVSLLQSLQDKLNAINPFPSALIDNSGKILTATAWQDICTKFHRLNPESEKECILSDQYILSHMDQANPAVTYKCPHGMVDNAIPIVVEGMHLANFFTGQFFLEPPDLGFFRKQAAKYGFDEVAYMEAVQKVPVWNQGQLPAYFDFIKTFTESIATMGLNRHREIEAIQLAKKNLKTLVQAIDCINECVSMTDTDNNILFVNQSFCNTYGYKADELLGRNIEMVRSPGQNDYSLSEILEDTLKGGWSGEAMNRKKDGTDFPVHISTALVHDDDNQTVALIGIATDITKWKKSESDMIAAKEKAEESDRLKSAFLANISHEIRTPMNSILGFAELIEDMTEDPKQLEYLRIITSGGERLLKIINSVIDIAKIEAGQENLSPVEFDVNSLLKELFELNKRRNIRIKFINDMVATDSMPLFTDKTKLFQVLNNLVSNALKYTTLGTVRFGYTKSSGHVTFYVKDTGIGIPEQFKGKVFERFQKVDLHNRSDFEGTGLGLAIAKQLVNMLNGEIWFESELGKGSTFFVSMPC